MEVDERFVEQLRRGDSAAFELLVERFEGPLYRFFFCEHRNHHVAEEQTTDTFAELVRSLPKMRGGPEQLRAYVFATARHVQQRRWRRRRKEELPLAEAGEVLDPGPMPSAAAEHREQIEQAFELIGGLEEVQRTVVRLRFVEELSINEIAEALAMPSGTVKSHIHRGREKLKQLLANRTKDHERTA